MADTPIWANALPYVVPTGGIRIPVATGPTSNGHMTVEGLLTYLSSHLAAPAQLPTGSVTMFCTPSVPSGWLSCDGSSYPISSYPTLAAMLGTTYGGDGSTFFRTPDLRGRVPVGITNSTGGGVGSAVDGTTWTINQKRGTETCSLDANQNGPHTHTDPFKGHSGDGDHNASNASQYYGSLSSGSAQTTGSSGLGAPHNNLQPSIGLNFIIKT